jgi:hypothetical protein
MQHSGVVAPCHRRLGTPPNCQVRSAKVHTGIPHRRPGRVCDVDGAVEKVGASRLRLAPVLAALALFAVSAVYMAPRGFDALALIAIQDDPVAIASRALDERFDSAAANREIAAALAAQDSDLAQSFADLAAERNVTIDPQLAAEVSAARAQSASARGQAESFTRGLITGEPTGGAALAGTALGDLFVFGDLRDLTREGIHAARGGAVDDLVVGLAAVGVAITAGTYVTLGITMPVRAGLTLIKAAVRTGRLSVKLTASLGRLLRRAVVGGSESAVAVRAARETVKIERAGGLMRFIGDVGRVESKAGTQAALDGLKLVQSPGEMSRVAKLAEKEGSKTRAILKLLGRDAIALAAATVDLAMWMLGALISALSFVAALKGMTERITSYVIRHRKAVRRRQASSSSARGDFGTMKIAGAVWRLSVRLMRRGAVSRIALAGSSR